MIPLPDGPTGRIAAAPASYGRSTRRRQRAAAAARARRWGALTVVSAAYALGALLWQALRFTPLAEWWLFELLDIFGLALFAPLPLLAVVAPLSGSRPAGLWLLAPLGLLAWEYGGLFLPQLPPTDGRPLRVLSANLLVTNGQHARVAALLAMEAPDLVALQELSPSMADHLARELKSAYPHQLLGPSEAPNGLGILSRYPLRDALDGMGWYTHVCECQRVIVHVDGRQVAFVNVHPPPPAVSLGRLGRLPIPAGFDPTQTNTPLAAALADIDPAAGPLLVVGDFNVSDRQPMYRRLRRDLLDAHREAGWGLGYSFPARSFAGFPELGLIRIDYVLHSDSVAARSARTGPTPGSDHHHVIADVVLP